MIKGIDSSRRTALLVSEMQNSIANVGFTQSPLSAQVFDRGIVARINALAARFRAAGLPVIHCLVSARAGFVGWPVNCALAARIKRDGQLVQGTPHAAIHDDIEVGAGDIICERHHGMTPFTGTDLAATLRALDIGTVVLTGVSTNVALMGAATEAVGNGFHVVLAEDCSAGGTAETHQIQITMHLPLVAAISTADAITQALEI